MERGSEPHGLTEFRQPSADGAGVSFRPSTNPGPYTDRAKVEESILSMKDEYTVIIVTHNMQQARRISDYTAFMFLGQIVEFGETRQIFEHPRKKATRDYIKGRFG